MPFIRCVYSGDKEVKDDIIVALSSAASVALNKVLLFSSSFPLLSHFSSFISHFFSFESHSTKSTQYPQQTQIQ